VRILRIVRTFNPKISRSLSQYAHSRLSYSLGSLDPDLVRILRIVRTFNPHCKPHGTAVRIRTINFRYEQLLRDRPSLTHAFSALGPLVQR
jgi:hypothetical protein